MARKAKRKARRRVQVIRANQRSLTAITPHNGNTRYLIPKRNTLAINPND